MKLSLFAIIVTLLLSLSLLIFGALNINFNYMENIAPYIKSYMPFVLGFILLCVSFSILATCFSNLKTEKEKALSDQKALMEQEKALSALDPVNTLKYLNWKILDLKYLMTQAIERNLAKETIETLLERGAPPNPALRIATKEGNIEAIEAILEKLKENEQMPDEQKPKDPKEFLRIRRMERNSNPENAAPQQTPRRS